MSDSQHPRAIDIRWPIGLLFGSMGVVLDAYGIADPSFGRVVPLHLNLDLWWGLALLVFGAGMLWGARRADRRSRP
jgi:hypothetical protein